jgi:dUTP pyrophosphatase
MVTVRVYNTSENKNPEYAHGDDAGFDLRSSEDITVGPRNTAFVDTGLRLDIPPGYEGQIRLRSSYAKRGIVITNAPGTIDAGYKGPIMVAVRNCDLYNSFQLKPGERFAQMVINELPTVTLVPVSKEEFFEEETSRSSGGFGSTGNF